MTCSRARVIPTFLLALGLVGMPCSFLAAQGVSASGLPQELIKTGIRLGSAAKAVRTDLKISWYDWSTLERQVIVKRRERQLATDGFVEQVQRISTPYFVTDVRWRCEGADEIKNLYVAGVYESGDSVIERWVFTYPSAVDSAGNYVPLDERPFPMIAKRRIYQGDALGRVRSLGPDPLGRFVLFLTYDDPKLYRIDAVPGNPVSVALDTATEPYLANVGVITIARHATEGPHVRLGVGTRWEVDLKQPRKVIVLRDGDDDGVFDPPELLTMEQWAERGYGNATAWVPVCANGSM